MGYTPLDVVLKTEHESYEMKVLRFILERDKQHRDELDNAHAVIGMLTIVLLFIFRTPLYNGGMAVWHYITSLF